MCPKIGEMELDCPGCCGKSFTCRKTLKKHLLHLLDKLRCPQCNIKFIDLLTLVNHLDECGDAEVNEEIEQNASAVEHAKGQVSMNQDLVSVCHNREHISDLEAPCPPNLELESSEIGQSLELHNEKMEEVPQSNNMEEFGLNVLIKNELAESTNLQEQQLTLLDNDGQSHILIMSQGETLQEQEIVTIQNDDGTISFSTPMEQESKNTETQYMTNSKYHDEEAKESDEEMEIYSCNTCSISFTSVHEHIREFHSDQDVVVEVAEAGAENKDELLTTPHQQLVQQPNTDTRSLDDTVIREDQEQQIQSDNQDMGTRRVITESGDIVEAQFKNVGCNDRTNNALDSKCKRSTLPGTFMEQQCVDKDGRIYTRRLVQIEKFWEDKELAKEVETPQEMPVEENAEGENYILGDCESGVTTVYHCALCYTQHLTMAEFDTHVCKQPISGRNKYTDPSLQVYSCDICSVTYSSLKSLCAHKKVHKKSKAADGKHSNVKSEASSPNILGPFKCGVCDTVFPTNKSLRLHRRMHDPVKMRTIEAPVEYPSSLDCEPTVRDPLDKYHCHVCNKWIHVGYRRIHDKYHASTQDFNCDICNRKFFTDENLVMHMNVHNTEKIQPQKSDKLLPYNCLYCPRQFARPHEKVKHERIHTGEKPHSCEICGKSFRVSYCLTLHMRTHTGARPYVCSHCGKRFKAHSVYNHHLLTHSEVRAYKCPFCPKAFKTSVQLAGHKNSHTKPFSCTECNRPFASLYAVRVHTETHKRQNNLKFSCTMCGASYARAFALKDHMRAHDQHAYVQLVEVDLEKDALSEENNAAMSIMPKRENSIEVEELTLGPDQEMELMQ